MDAWAAGTVYLSSVEVLSHLSTVPGAKLRVSVEIEAEMPEGAPEVVQRTVSENAGVLKFDSHGFERE